VCICEIRNQRNLSGSYISHAKYAERPQPAGARAVRSATPVKLAVFFGADILLLAPNAALDRLCRCMGLAVYFKGAVRR
jgi:hypothetical protein